MMSKIATAVTVPLNMIGRTLSNDHGNVHAPTSSVVSFPADFSHSVGKRFFLRREKSQLRTRLYTYTIGTDQELKVSQK